MIAKSMERVFLLAAWRLFIGRSPGRPLPSRSFSSRSAPRAVLRDRRHPGRQERPKPPSIDTAAGSQRVSPPSAGRPLAGDRGRIKPEEYLSGAGRSGRLEQDLVLSEAGAALSCRLSG